MTSECSNLESRFGFSEFLEQQVSLFSDATGARLLLVSLAQHFAQRPVRRLEVGKPLQQRLALSLHRHEVLLRQTLLLKALSYVKNSKNDNNTQEN